VGKRSTPEEPCILLPWDTEHWGFPVARLQPETLSKKDCDLALEWCRIRGVRCLYFCADGTCPETFQHAHQAGFRFVDVRLDLECVPFQSAITADTIQNFRPAKPVDLVGLKRLARESHGDTRFFKDKNFDPEKARELYMRWLERDLRENHVFLASDEEPEPSPLGYVTAELGTTGLARIGLVAVASRARHRGLGKGLLSHVLTWLACQGASKVRVATQATNIQALRLYEGAGFRAEKSRVWFHRWFH